MTTSTPTLRPDIVDKIRAAEGRLLADGALLSDYEARRTYETFRARFGTGVLAGLDFELQ